MNRHKIFHRFTSLFLIAVGTLLIIGPRQWFPGFHQNPAAIGAAFLFAPVLIYLPSFVFEKNTLERRRLVFTIRSITAFSILVNVIGELGAFQLYRFGFEYDKFAHFIVSMAFTFALCETLVEWKRFNQPMTILMSIPIIFSFGIFWEFIEFSLDSLFGTRVWGVYGQNAISDTLKDITFNTIGIVCGIVIFKIPKKPRR